MKTSKLIIKGIKKGIKKYKEYKERMYEEEIDEEPQFIEAEVVEEPEEIEIEKPEEELEIVNEQGQSVEEEQEVKSKKKTVIKVIAGTVIAASTIAAFATLVPAIAASSMLDNAQEWHNVGMAVQNHLHHENVNLSSYLSMGGKEVLFDSVTGVWNINGIPLNEYASKLISKAIGLFSVSTIGLALTTLTLGKNNKRVNRIKNKFKNTKLGKYLERNKTNKKNNDLTKETKNTFNQTVTNQVPKDNTKNINIPEPCNIPESNNIPKTEDSPKVEETKKVVDYNNYERLLKNFKNTVWANEKNITNEKAEEMKERLSKLALEYENNDNVSPRDSVTLNMLKSDIDDMLNTIIEGGSLEIINNNNEEETTKKTPDKKDYVAQVKELADIIYINEANIDKEKTKELLRRCSNILREMEENEKTNEQIQNIENYKTKKLTK